MVTAKIGQGVADTVVVILNSVLVLGIILQYIYIYIYDSCNCISKIIFHVVSWFQKLARNPYKEVSS